MLEVQMSGNLVVIDVRQRALKGEHPGDEVIEYTKKSSNDFIFEYMFHMKLNL